MDKDILIRFINCGMSQRDIAEETGVAQSTIKYWLKKLKLQTNFLPFNKIPGPPKCSHCGETDVNNFYMANEKINHPSCCIECYNIASIDKFRKIKKQCVDYKGGKCVICGYDKSCASLNFHHIDPKEKDSKWSTMKNWSFNRKKSELDKCILVCSNCHAEIHESINHNKTNIKNRNNKTNIKNRDNKNKAINLAGGKCVICGYNKSDNALEFHHIDQKTKSSNWNNIKNTDRAKIEREGCDLLCSTCHGEIHQSLRLESN